MIAVISLVWSFEVNEKVVASFITPSIYEVRNKSASLDKLVSLCGKLYYYPSAARIESFHCESVSHWGIEMIHGRARERERGSKETHPNSTAAVNQLALGKATFHLCECNKSFISSSSSLPALVSIKEWLFSSPSHLVSKAQSWFPWMTVVSHKKKTRRRAKTTA